MEKTLSTTYVYEQSKQMYTLLCFPTLDEQMGPKWILFMIR